VTDHPADTWLTELFHAHSGAVLTYARRRLASPEDAEDVVVEVFATAWRRRETVPQPALPWLYATAANVIAHVIRSDGRRTRLDARLASVSRLHDPGNLLAHDPGAAVADLLSDRAAIQAALDDLSDSDAELLRLWAWEQLEPIEIAQVLDCSPGTARTRMHRARARLREALLRRGVTGPAVQQPDPGIHQQSHDLTDPDTEASR
jgi:RNA polymerase sigma-70 factor, ECF subfamily